MNDDNLVVRSVRLVPGDFRTPRAIAEVALGPLLLRLTVVGMAGGKLGMRQPLAADGTAGLVLPPGIDAAVAAACLRRCRTRPRCWQG